MVFKKKPKIGIIVGLKSEKRTITSNKNLFIETGYGKKAYEAANKVIKHKIDLIVSFGLAGSMTKKLKNSQIIMPKEVLNKEFNSKRTSIVSNTYFKKRSKVKIIDSVRLLTSEKVLNEKINNSLIDAVDMEASFVQKAAMEHKIPFTSIKVIFDDKSNSIPNFLINSVDDDGKLKVLNLFIQILKNPFRIKNLFKLSKIYGRSMKQLKSIASQLF